MTRLVICWLRDGEWETTSTRRLEITSQVQPQYSCPVTTRGSSSMEFASSTSIKYPRVLNSDKHDREQENHKHSMTIQCSCSWDGGRSQDLAQSSHEDKDNRLAALGSPPLSPLSPLICLSDATAAQQQHSCKARTFNSRKQRTTS